MLSARRRSPGRSRWPALRGLGAALALALAAHAAAPAGSQSRLRQLSHLPRLSLSVGVSFDGFRGFAMVGGRVVPSKELADLRQAIQDSAGDATRFARLARLYGQGGEDKEARTAASRAVELFRQQAVEQSGDGLLLTDFGAVLHCVGRFDEAERLLRRAATLMPDDWRPRAALGRLLSAQTLAALLPRSQAGSATLAGLAEDLVHARPEPDQAEKARALSHEAVECCDRAVALAPAAAEPLAGRAAARSTRRMVQVVLESADGADAQELRVLKAIYSPDALEDLREAARRSPKDPSALGTAVLFEVLASSLERGIPSLETLANGEAWNLMSDAARRFARDALARLEELGQSSDPHLAAAALEVLGTCQASVVRDLRGAEATLRRAIELDPGRDPAWNGLIFLLATSKRPADLLTVCTDWLQRRESARARLLVAKALEQLGRWDQVVSSVETLHRRYPDNLEANLALAAALVRTVEGPTPLPRIVHCLSRAEKLLGNTPTADQIRSFLFTRGLVFALGGEPDRARDDFRQVLDLDKADADAREALDILEQTVTPAP
jgi:tetratricopeptide (TPR) repeat protein